MVVAAQAVFALSALCQRLPFKHFTAEDGLAATQIWHVTQDRRGLLWISTSWGINRYDGESFSTFSVAEGLPSSTARLVLEDPAGNLWFGTNEGLARYDGSAIESFMGRGGAFAATIWGGSVDRHGALWFATASGLLSFDAGEFRTYASRDGLADDYVYGLLLSRDGALWAASRGHGVSRCVLERGGRLGHCRRFSTRDGLAGDSVHAMIEGDDGTIYFGTRGGGLSLFDGAKFATVTMADGLPLDDIYALAIREGELLVGTDAGIGRCALPAGRPCRQLTEKHGLPDDGIRYFFEDREAVLWIGAEGGLMSLEREDVLTYGEPEGIPDAHVYALESDGTGGVWVGTFNGLAHLELGPQGEPSVRTYGATDGLPANWIWALLKDRRGDLWVGSESGLSRLLPNGRFETWKVAEGLAGDYVSGLCEDRAGAIWVAATEGVSRVELPRDGLPGGRPKFTAFRVEDGLATARSYACSSDDEGRIWVSHGIALSYFDGERFRALTAGSGLASRSARALGAGRDGRLWVGGQGQVARLLPGASATPPQFLALETRGALADVLVLTIAEDEHGHLVLGTNHGVLTLALEAPDRAVVISRFDRRGGALASEVSHSSAFTSDDQGRSWFGFKGGATVFQHTAERRVDRPPPHVYFELLESGRGGEWRAPYSAVLVAGQESLVAGSVELPVGDRSLRIEARASTLLGEGALEFQFQLVGVEPDWSEPRPTGSREYAGLRPGNYRLLARARVGREMPWSEVAELAVRLPPNWWETRAAAALAALLLAAAIFGAAHWRTRSVAAKNRGLETEVAERTDDLTRYTRALEEQVQALDRANERIRQADRHRGEFLAKMSHELRTPLTSVLGFTALLKDGLEGSLEARHDRYLLNIRESGNHLLRLINNLLDQAKIEAGKMDLHLEPANVEAVIDSALALVEGFAAMRSVRVTGRKAGALPPVVTDVAKLRQIVINLVSNAIKFSPAGAEVEVTSRPVEPAGSGLGIAAFEIAVADRGPGVDPADRERIFEPFRQLAARGESVPGTGLGLPIVRQFANLLGGTVIAEAREGGGALFLAQFPLDSPAHGASAAAGLHGMSAGPPGTRTDSSHVLVVEPDRGRFTTLAADLDRRGFLAVRARDAEEAGRMLREVRPAILAIDIDVSRLEVWAALSRLERELRRDAVPLVLVAFARGSERGIAARFQRLFAAPVASAEILAALRGAEDSRSPRGRPVIWIAAGHLAAPAALDDALVASGYEVVRRPPRHRAIAEAAAGRFAAAIVDLGEASEGGFDLALQAQSAGDSGLFWIAIAPHDLTPSERRRLLELADGAHQSAGSAVVAAVERLISRPSG